MKNVTLGIAATYLIICITPAFADIPFDNTLTLQKRGVVDQFMFATTIIATQKTLISSEFVQRQIAIQGITRERDGFKKRLEIALRQRKSDEKEIAALKESADQKDVLLANAQEKYVREVALGDPKLSATLSETLRTVNGLVLTPEGEHAIELINAGRAPEAVLLLDKYADSVIETFEQTRDRAIIAARERAVTLVGHRPNDESIRDFEKIAELGGARASDWTFLVDLYQNRGDRVKAAEAARHAFELSTGDAERAGLAVARARLAPPEEALGYLASATELGRNLSGDNALWLEGNIEWVRGATYFHLGQGDKNIALSRSSYLKAIAFYRKLYGASPTINNKSNLFDVVQDFENLHGLVGQDSSRESRLSELVQLSTELDQAASSIRTKEQAAYTLTLRGRFRYAQGAYSEAISDFDHSLIEYKALAAKDQSIGRYNLNIAYLYSLKGHTYKTQQEYFLAMTEMTNSIVEGDKLVAAYPGAEYKNQLAAFYLERGNIEISLANFSAAKGDCKKAETLISTSGAHTSIDDDVAFQAGLCLTRLSADGYDWKRLTEQFRKMKKSGSLSASTEELFNTYAKLYNSN